MSNCRHSYSLIVNIAHYQHAEEAPSEKREMMGTKAIASEWYYAHDVKVDVTKVKNAGALDILHLLQFHSIEPGRKNLSTSLV